MCTDCLRVYVYKMYEMYSVQVTVVRDVSQVVCRHSYCSMLSQSPTISHTDSCCATLYSINTFKLHRYNVLTRLTLHTNPSYFHPVRYYCHLPLCTALILNIIESTSGLSLGNTLYCHNIPKRWSVLPLGTTQCTISKHNTSTLCYAHT
jgi:hypothetical protein